MSTPGRHLQDSAWLGATSDWPGYGILLYSVGCQVVCVFATEVPDGMCALDRWLGTGLLFKGAVYLGLPALTSQQWILKRTASCHFLANPSSLELMQAVRLVLNLKDLAQEGLPSSSG